VELAAARPRILALGQPLVVRVGSPEDAFPQRPRSFPSGHAWNAFALATFITTCNRRWGWLAFLPAAAIAYARVYGGAHWPSDVLASAVAGPCVTLLLLWALERAWQALAPRIAPRLHAACPRLVFPEAS
jgi:undecaprenyl-diphosphatase